nr:MAG TPA: hypothetical protein [Caudoviricetes sp.]
MQESLSINIKKCVLCFTLFFFHHFNYEIQLKQINY